jgi:integrase
MEHKKESYAAYVSGEKTLSEKEVELFLSKINTIYDEAFFRLAINTGMRRDDIVNVRQADVNLAERTVSYFERKKRRIRTVPISEATAQKLAQHIAVCGRREWLFPSPQDPKGHISSRQVYNRFQYHLKAAGLEPRPFHVLRATCIKMCQRKGWLPEEAARLIGDDLRTVQLHYSVPTDAEMKELMKEKEVV